MQRLSMTIIRYSSAASMPIPLGIDDLGARLSVLGIAVRVIAGGKSGGVEMERF